MVDVADQEKVQVGWGIALFAKFLFLAEKSGAFDPAHTVHFRQEVAKLEEDIQKGESAVKGIERLNQIINKLNSEMKQNSEPAKYAPFPFFSSVKQGERSGVLDQFDMLQRTLTEASEAKVMDWVKEGEYFKEILKLFTLVEKGKLNPHEAMAQLAKAIDQVNSTFPKDFQLPSINLNAYPT